MVGTVSILNVGTGDTKLTFDNSNPAETIRAARIVKDMLRRGYALLVEFEEGGEKFYRRAKDFDEKVCEYIIADFDPVVAAEADAIEASNEENKTSDASAEFATEARPRTKNKVGSKRLKAEKTNVIAVGRTAGG